MLGKTNFRNRKHSDKYARVDGPTKSKQLSTEEIFWSLFKIIYEFGIVHIRSKEIDSETSTCVTDAFGRSTSRKGSRTSLDSAKNLNL